MDLIIPEQGGNNLVKRNWGLKGVPSKMWKMIALGGALKRINKNKKGVTNMYIQYCLDQNKNSRNTPKWQVIPYDLTQNFPTPYLIS